MRRIEVHQMTPDEVDEARGWCHDVHVDVDAVDAATDEDVAAYVDRNYEGGIVAFLADIRVT